MRVALGVVALLVLLAGCSESPDPVDEPLEEMEAVEDPWAGGTRSLALDWHATTQEFDVLCVSGGAAFELERAGPIPPGANHLAITITTEATFTGLQAGYSLDGGQTITWLPAVRGGPHIFEVPVAQDQWEDPEAWAMGDEVWSFHHQMNLPDPATQDCYTGYADGEWSIVVEALKA